MHGPSLGISVHHFFVGVMPMVQYENDLSLNEPLHAALANGAPFTPNTYYALYDNVRAQSAIGLQLGTALPLMQSGNPREGGMGLYAGIRGKRNLHAARWRLVCQGDGSVAGVSGLQSRVRQRKA